MSHAAALTSHAVSLLDGRDRAKRLSALVECSYRTVQDWTARRRRMCLDHAVELAANNDEFRAALLARIEQARGRNAVASRQAADLVGGQNALDVGSSGDVGHGDRERGAALGGVAADLTGRTRP